MLSDAMIASAIADRFGRWGRFLRRSRATPIVVVGLTQEKQIVVTTVEDMSQEMIAGVLIAAAQNLSHGRVEER